MSEPISKHTDLETVSEHTKTGRLLLADGPMMLREFNPRGVLHFMGRKCMTCGQEIMDHWLVPHENQDMRSSYWCDRMGTLASQGMEE